MSALYVVQFERDASVLFALHEVTEAALLNGLNDEEIEGLVLNPADTQADEGFWAYTLKFKGVDLTDPTNRPLNIWVTAVPVY